MTKNSDSSWFQLDSNVAGNAAYISFKIGLFFAFSDHQNQNFMIVADSLDEAMSKC